jgi:ribokinase
MPSRVTIVGSLNMDLIALSPRIPQPGETIIGKEFQTAPGGKGANQAVAAAHLGAQVSMVGQVGDDAFADSLLENLASAGVDHNFVTRDQENATGVALIVVDDHGENSIVVASGANMNLTPADVESAEKAIAAADALLLQLEIPLETVIRAAELARAHQVTVILNPAPARALPEKLLHLVDFLIPNETETALLSGMSVTNQVEIEAAAESLRHLGVGNVILTLGSRGALLTGTFQSEVYPSFKVNPVDTTAAGDAFLGGFAVALGEGKSLSDAIRFGNAAGALATTRLGAQPSLPTRAEVELLIRNKV